MIEAEYADCAVHRGDCMEVMTSIPANSIDAIVTDPPYGLGFMGKAWDDLPPGLPWAQECLRLLKPGGHLLAFGGTRTSHRLAVAIEDAGFEIRDSIAWLYGSGFPKSLNVGKAIDKAAGIEREVIGPATEAAKQWDGFGTALKPAHEPIIVARKPFPGTVAANVLAHGTGVLNINATRLELNGDYKCKPNGRPSLTGLGDNYDPAVANMADTVGRWPPNVCLDESQAAALDEQSGISRSVSSSRGERHGVIYGGGKGPTGPDTVRGHADSGGASRFFYVAKAPKRERPVVDGIAHPTVKPLALMRWLCRLVTPPGGSVLDPFAGTGTTLEAAYLEGFKSIGIERERDYLPLIAARMKQYLGREGLPA